MQVKTYNLDVKDSIFDPNCTDEKQKYIAHFKKHALSKKDESKKDKTFYKVWLYLEGPDLPFVKSVKYYLHKSFPNPVKMVERKASNSNCALVLWTWGFFTVKVEIEDMKGRVITMEHYLNYGNELKSDKIAWENEGFIK